MDWSLLEKISATSKPVICSTGGRTVADVDKIVTFLEHRDVTDLALLHCVGIYPTPDESQQLGFMRRMIRRYPHCAIGYSGHESPDNLGVARAVIAMGAQVMERHVGVETDEISLNPYSMNPAQTDSWVDTIVSTRKMCELTGDDKRVREEEVTSLRSLARGVFARTQIRAGERLDPEKVILCVPCSSGQTTASEYLPSMVASQDYGPLDAICERRVSDPIRVVRSVVHEAKGLLREAGISIGTTYDLELSHHYGMDSFRRFGAVIVNIVNREYCKKLIILLPGQTHPSHAHVKKEETFQLLYGDLELVVGNETKRMIAGDTQLIKRGEYHSFGTRQGAIFEEISTTHHKGDSIYEDDEINRLDPLERKSTIDEW